MAVHPTPDDPLAQREDPTSMDGMLRAFEKVVDARIAEAWRGRTSTSTNFIPDAVLCMELIARGWIVYKPAPPAT